VNHRFITLGRIINSGVQNFIRNAWLSIAATAVMVVALTIILFAVVLNITGQNAIAELSKNLKVSIYLKDDVPTDTVQSLATVLRQTPYVDNVEFVSKEAAQQKFTQSLENDEQLLEGLALVGGDTLPASYEVSVTDLNRLTEVEDITKQERYQAIIDSVTLGKTDARKTIDRAAAAQRYIIVSSVISASIFGIVSVLIIFNTIRMAIFTRGEEIRIMKLIGATPNYIRGPFLVEASIYGIIAGILANTAVYSIVLSLGSKVQNQAEFAQTYMYMTKTSTVLMFLFSAIGLGILVGLFSSLLAMSKHLKLKHW
jgi:cell division transport system permease protein